MPSPFLLIRSLFGENREPAETADFHRRESSWGERGDALNLLI